MEDSLIKKIDESLLKCKNEGFINLTKSSEPEIRQAINISVTKGFLTKKSSHSYMMTESGFEVITSGGYKSYVQQVNSEKDYDNEIKQLTIKQLRGNVFHLKYWWLLLLINVIVSGIISYLVIYLTK